MNGAAKTFFPVRACVVDVLGGDAAVYERCYLRLGPLEADHPAQTQPGTETPLGLVAEDGKCVVEQDLKSSACSFAIDNSLIISAKKATVVVHIASATDAAAVRAALDPPPGALALSAVAPPPAAAGQAANHFDAKTDATSADMYFHYYGMLQHQQNMLQDGTRTGTYFWAIMQNPADFADKVVVDVGAGSGILSLFAAQAGARKVYAIEASDMAHQARRLAAANSAVGSRVEVVHGKLESVALPERADVLISEPMGTLLVNERMLETYVYAREHLLKPGGKMFPSLGRIYAAAFQDAALHAELVDKAAFWLNPSFYGVNLRSLHAPALEGYFNKVVIDAFDPGLLVSTWAQHPLDFSTITEDALQDITVPLTLACRGGVTLHGIACWFDVLFPGSQQPVWLSTAPGMPVTHWFQLRCVFKTPIHIQADGTSISGSMRLVAHSRQSYDIHVHLQAPPAAGSSEPQIVRQVFDLKDPHYRQLAAPWWPAAASAMGTDCADVAAPAARAPPPA